MRYELQLCRLYVRHSVLRVHGHPRNQSCDAIHGMMRPNTSLNNPPYVSTCVDGDGTMWHAHGCRGGRVDSVGDGGGRAWVWPCGGGGGWTVGVRGCVGGCAGGRGAHDGERIVDECDSVSWAWLWWRG